MKSFKLSFIILLGLALLFCSCTGSKPASVDEEGKAKSDAAQTAGEAWFKDCLMIGDSRLRGMILYSALEVGADYTFDGFTTAQAMREECVPEGDGKIIVPQAIAQGASFQKCCIMLGVNEAGYRSADDFRADYEALIAAVKERSPSCTVYLLAEYSVSAAFTQTSDLTPAAIQNFNEIVRDICEKTNSIYIDLFTPFADGNGCLSEGLSSDGLHMTPDASRTLMQQILQQVDAAGNDR